MRQIHYKINYRALIGRAVKLKTSSLTNPFTSISQWYTITRRLDLQEHRKDLFRYGKTPFSGGARLFI
jgi:hypothetical protein